MLQKQCVLVGMALASFLVGCAGGDRIQEEQIEVKASNDPLYEPREILSRYAQGQAPGSEVTAFPDMVERVRAIDPATADILQQGFAEIEKAPRAERVAKSKELLSKIQPQAY